MVGAAIAMLPVWLRALRLPFSTAIVLPVLFAAAGVRVDGRRLDPVLLALLLGAGVAIHLGANLLNDYFDHRSGVDDGNSDPITPLAGGSRVLQEGRLSARSVLVAGCLLVGVSLAIGLGFGVARASFWWLGLLAVGLLLAVGYSAPPIAANYRRCGEAFVFLAFGALPVFCGYFLLTGVWSVQALARSLPLACAVTGIVYVAEFPDRASDRRGGKRTLPVVLGHRTAAWGYVVLQALGSGGLVLLCAVGWLPTRCLFGLLAVMPMGYAAWVLLRARDDSPPARFRPAVAAAIAGHLVLGVLLTLGCWV